MFTYTINIVFHHYHFAIVRINHGSSEPEARAIFKTFCERFPASDGYSLTLRRHPREVTEQIAYSEGA